MKLGGVVLSMVTVWCVGCHVINVEKYEAEGLGRERIKLLWARTLSERRAAHVSHTFSEVVFGFAAGGERAVLYEEGTMSALDADSGYIVWSRSAASPTWVFPAEADGHVRAVARSDGCIRVEDIDLSSDQTAASPSLLGAVSLDGADIVLIDQTSVFVRGAQQVVPLQVTPFGIMRPIVGDFHDLLAAAQDGSGAVWGGLGFVSPRRGIARIGTGDGCGTLIPFDEHVSRIACLGGRVFICGDNLSEIDVSQSVIRRLVDGPVLGVMRCRIPNHVWVVRRSSVAVHSIDTWLVKDELHPPFDIQWSISDEDGKRVALIGRGRIAVVTL